MGLFSFVGKALKGVAKVASFIPGVGGTISKIAGTVGGLLDHKKPMSTTSAKINATLLNGSLATRGKSTFTGGMWTPSVLRSTPIMPGGAVSTPGGMLPAGYGGGQPPTSFGGARASSSSRRRKRRAAPTTRKRRKARLKFGSPAWRKKYLTRGRRRRAA